MSDPRLNGQKCPIKGCLHALSTHNDLGYCRSRTTRDRSGECLCQGTTDPTGTMTTYDRFTGLSKRVEEYATTPEETEAMIDAGYLRRRAVSS